MFKVISAEIKKMVSKPGIYVLAAFLAVILVLGVLIYKPEVKPASDASEVFAQTGFTLANYKSEKEKYDSYIESSVNAVNTYKLTYTSDGKLKLDEYLNNLHDAEVYMQTTAEIDDYNNKEKQAAATDLMNAIFAIRNFLTQDLASFNSVDGVSYAIFCSNENQSQLTECVNRIKIEYDTLSVSEAPDYKAFYGYFTKNYNDQLVSCINNYYFPKLPSETIADYTELINAQSKITKYGTVISALQEIDTKINKLFEGVNGELSYDNNGKKLDEFITLINDYANTTNSYLNMVKYELLTNAFDSLKANKQYILTDLSDETKFSADTNFTKYSYIFKNHKVIEDYSSPLAVGTTIGNEKSAYDYSYFILKLFSIVILTYAIMSACHTIAGEIKEGSMRYFAIRPISRGEILFGKLISVVLMSSIILLFSAIISLIVGAAVYGGFGAKPILTIFNGTTTMVIHPLGMLGLYLLSFIVQIVIYASIALMLSTLLKSDLLAITIMLLIYILNLLLPVFSGGMKSWLMFYPFSHISLFALFGSSLYTNTSDLLSRLLAENVYAGTSIITVGIVSLVLIIVPLVIAKLAFKNKEL